MPKKQYSVNLRFEASHFAHLDAHTQEEAEAIALGAYVRLWYQCIRDVLPTTWDERGVWTPVASLGEPQDEPKGEMLLHWGSEEIRAVRTVDRNKRKEEDDRANAEARRRRDERLGIVRTEDRNKKTR